MRLARWWVRADDGGGESAVVDPSLGAASLEGASDGVASGAVTAAWSARLQLVVWEQWM
jgi:hypothetical protein